MSKYRPYIEEIIDNIGCPRHLKGYEAIIEAIDYQTTNPGVSMMDTYYAVAKKFDWTSHQTERNIRHIISNTLATCDYRTLKKYFGNSLLNTYGVTNKQFVMTISITVRRLKIKEEKVC